MRNQQLYVLSIQGFSSCKSVLDFRHLDFGPFFFKTTATKFPWKMLRIKPSSGRSFRDVSFEQFTQRLVENTHAIIEQDLTYI